MKPREVEKGLWSILLRDSHEDFFFKTEYFNQARRRMAHSNRVIWRKPTEPCAQSWGNHKGYAGPQATVDGEALPALGLHEPEERVNRNSLEKASHGNWGFCLRGGAPPQFSKWLFDPEFPFSFWSPGLASYWPNSTRSPVSKGAHPCRLHSVTTGAATEGTGVEIGPQRARGKVCKTERC